MFRYNNQHCHFQTNEKLKKRTTKKRYFKTTSVHGGANLDGKLRNDQGCASQKTELTASASTAKNVDGVNVSVNKKTFSVNSIVKF